MVACGGEIGETVSTILLCLFRVKFTAYPFYFHSISLIPQHTHTHTQTHTRTHKLSLFLPQIIPLIFYLQPRRTNLTKPSLSSSSSIHPLMHPPIHPRTHPHLPSNHARMYTRTLIAISRAPSFVLWPPMNPLAWIKIAPGTPACTEPKQTRFNEIAIMRIVATDGCFMGNH